MSSECNIKFRKLGKLVQSRKRREDSSSESEDLDICESIASISHLAKKHGGISHTTAKKSRNARNNESYADDEAQTSEINIKYKAKSDADRVGPKDMGATATLEIETEHDKDAQSQFERIQVIAKESKGKTDDGLYRGIASYGQFFDKKDTAVGNASSGLNRKGPIRAPTNVRQSVRWDYKPDICKDYKETGFCGFGDSCIFMHDRSDYKFGWEIEREYDEGRYGKSDEDPSQYEIHDEVEELSLNCLICRQLFVNPIVTKCKHYFCEKCALAQFQKSHKCYICSKGTGGIFTPAKDIIAKLSGLKETKKTQRDYESDVSSEENDTPIEKLVTEKANESDSDDGNEISNDEGHVA